MAHPGQESLLQGDAALGAATGIILEQDAEYLKGLLRERESFGLSQGLDLTKRLVSQEIERLQTGLGPGRSSSPAGGPLKVDDRRMTDVTKDKAIKLTVRVLVPVRDHPKFNFVGKLLGPKGNSLKRLQEETMTKMAILGRGSMRDKQKEEELRSSADPKFQHLLEDLHVEVTAVAPPAEAHARIAYALTEIRRYLVPDYNDDIRQEQMREIQLMNEKGTTNNNENETSNGKEGSCSPNSSSPTPPTGTGKLGRLSGGLAASAFPVTTPHPAFRGVSNSQTSMATAAGGKEYQMKKRNGRRSVLSLLTRARAIQQKEHEFLEAYQEMPVPGYAIYDPIPEMPLSDSDDMTGRAGGAIKVTPNPGDRARFRHDPYSRMTAST